MRQESAYANNHLGARLAHFDLGGQRTLIIGVILFIALIAFEIFNFDTTQFALESLLGDITFVGLKWATILAIAFCAIDFAGLFRLFTPERGRDEPRAVWYLMGAWLLGATMNAVMTWWAVSLTLLNHEFGNEVLSRQQLLRYVPIFVAVLVWLTRILFIGSFTMAGEKLFHGDARRPNTTAPAQAPRPAVPARATSTRAATPQRAPQTAQPRTAAPAPSTATQRPASQPQPAAKQEPAPPTSPARDPRPSRIRQRPPGPTGGVRRVPNGVHARSSNGSGNGRH